MREALGKLMGTLHRPGGWYCYSFVDMKVVIFGCRSRHKCMKTVEERRAPRVWERWLRFLVRLDFQVRT